MCMCVSFEQMVYFCARCLVCFRVLRTVVQHFVIGFNDSTRNASTLSVKFFIGPTQ